MATKETPKPQDINFVEVKAVGESGDKNHSNEFKLEVMDSFEMDSDEFDDDILNVRQILSDHKKDICVLQSDHKALFQEHQAIDKKIDCSTAKVMAELGEMQTKMEQKLQELHDIQTLYVKTRNDLSREYNALNRFAGTLLARLEKLERNQQPNGNIPNATDQSFLQRQQRAPANMAAFYQGPSSHRK